MKRFSFKLDSVLMLRAQLERQAQQALASELEHHARLEGQLATAAQRVRDAQSAGAAPGAVQFVGDLQAAQAYRERLEREQRVARATLADQEIQVAAERERLTAAARNHETLRRLKERRRGEHAAAAARAEASAMEEIALAGHRRQARGGAA
jgi:flagellar protein FliJ